MAFVTLEQLQPQILQLQRDLSDFNRIVNGNSTDVITVTSGFQIPSILNVLTNVQGQADTVLARIDVLLTGLNTNIQAVLQVTQYEVEINSSNVGGNITVLLPNIISIEEVSLNGLAQSDDAYTLANSSITLIKTEINYNIGDVVEISYFVSHS